MIENVIQKVSSHGRIKIDWTYQHMIHIKHGLQTRREVFIHVIPFLDNVCLQFKLSPRRYEDMHHVERKTRRRSPSLQ